MRPRALVLDRSHHVLLVGDESSRALPRVTASEATPRPPDPDAAGDERPLDALGRTLATFLGADPGAPIGARPLLGAPFEFVFLVDRPEREHPRAVWAPIRTIGTHVPEEADAVWRLYTDVMLGGFEPPKRDIDVFAFGEGAEMAAHLAHLVAKGTKRATSAWLEVASKDDVIPYAGLFSIVTDGFGFPVCCIRTERTERVRFADVGEEIARAEGEGDRSLAYWRETHRRFFTAEGASAGRAFDAEAHLLVEFFRVVKIFGTAA